MTNLNQSLQRRRQTECRTLLGLLLLNLFSSIPVYYMSNILFSKKFLASINAIIRRFWWTGVRDDNASRYLCLRAWADICTDKKSGGLGIRNLQALNQSLILSAAWRNVQNPISDLALILKSKYHADTSLWKIGRAHV